MMLNTTILTGIDRSTLLQWLTDARNAYAQLLTGGRPVTISYDGKSVTYTQTNIANLTAWIMQLQAELGIGGRRRAFRPYF